MMATMYEGLFDSRMLNMLLVDRNDYDNRPFIASYKPGIERYFISEVQLDKFILGVDDNSFLLLDISNVIEAKSQLFHDQMYFDRGDSKNNEYKQPEDEVIKEYFEQPVELYDYVVKTGKINMMKKLLNNDKDYSFYHYLSHIIDSYFEHPNFPEFVKGNTY
jgi:hypothetical protein